MVYCTKCGKQNPDIAKFCTGCGTQLAKVSIASTEDFTKKKTILPAITILVVFGLCVAAYFIFFNNRGNRNNQSDTKTQNLTDQVTPPTTESLTHSYVDVSGKLVYKSDCFVIITGSYTEEANAINAISTTKASGNTNVGYLWRPDYPSINDKYFYSTFIGPYETYAACENDLRIYKPSNIYWYGLKVSYSSNRVEIR